MLRAVIFDMDGVVINSEPDHINLEKQMFHERGICLSNTEHEGFMGLSSRSMWDRIKKRHSLTQSVEDLVAEETKRYLEMLHAQNGQNAVPGVVPLIRDLRAHGLKLAVASSATRVNIALVLNLLRLEGLFLVKVSGEDVSEAKPSPDIFLLTASKLGINPSDCLVIEDSANGILAANRAGMVSLGYQNPDSGNQDLSLAQGIVHDFQDLSYEKILAFYTSMNGKY